MAGPRPERSLLAMIWRNFRDSLTRARRTPGQLVGKDHLGTSYYEIPAEPRRGKRRPSRWFETTTQRKEKFDQEIPAEWEAWLRLRRNDPPSLEEVNANLAMAQRKKILAAEIDAKEKPMATAKTVQEPIGQSKTEYPAYKEYEAFPGSKGDKR